MIFATHNPHKVFEVSLIMNLPKLNLQSLKDIGFTEEIIEDGTSFRENALRKVEALQSKGYASVIGEDSGLEVEYLKGEPGIYSARYSGEPVDHDRNISKLLSAMAGTDQRNARFTSCICLLFEDNIHYFEGYCNGKIDYQRTGSGGFGYDPVFIPEGYTESFAVLSDEQKSKISHRYKSFAALGNYLKDKI